MGCVAECRFEAPYWVQDGLGPRGFNKPLHAKVGVTHPDEGHNWTNWQIHGLQKFLTNSGARSLTGWQTRDGWAQEGRPGQMQDCASGNHPSARVAWKLNAGVKPVNRTCVQCTCWLI